MNYSVFKHNCYNLYTIKTNRFNITRIEVVFKLKCTKENISFLALLFDVLMHSSNKYKTNKELNRVLDSMYDANMYSSITRIGQMLIVSAVIEVLDNNIIKNNLTFSAIDLLFECLFNPNLINSVFSYKEVEYAKRSMLDEIKSIKEDTKQSSILEALKLLGKDDIRGLSISGDEDIISEITSDSLYNFYKYFMNESIKEVYVLGNINSNMIDEYIFNNIKFNSIPIIDIPIYLRDLKAKRLNKNYGLDTKLVNYVEIYSIPKLTYFEENYVMIVFNAIWGSASLESRLYKALRTKRGLCYNVNTYYQKYDKCLILHSKVESKKIKEVSKIIKSTLRELIKNGVTSKEVASAKRIILNTISLIKDSPTKLIDNLMFQNMNILDNIDERRKQFNKITSDDVIKLAKKLKLIITYSQGDLK